MLHESVLEHKNQPSHKCSKQYRKLVRESVEKDS